jgi:hypothetical protein
MHERMAKSNSKSLLLGNAALVVWGSVYSTTTDTAALHDWWTNEHLPERLSIPGFVRARRYVCEEYGSKYMTFYEAASLDTLTSKEYMEKLNNPTPGTKEHIPTLATMKRAACEVLLSQRREELMVLRTAVGASVAMADVSIAADVSGDAVASALSRHFGKLAQDNKNVMAVHLLREDKAATAPGSQSQSYVNGNLASDEDADAQRLVLLLEFSVPSRGVLSKKRMVDYCYSAFDEGGAGRNQLELTWYDLLCCAEGPLGSSTGVEDVDGTKRKESESEHDVHPT